MKLSECSKVNFTNAELLKPITICHIPQLPDNYINYYDPPPQNDKPTSLSVRVTLSLLVNHSLQSCTVITVAFSDYSEQHPFVVGRCRRSWFTSFLPNSPFIVLIRERAEEQLHLESNIFLHTTILACKFLPHWTKCMNIITSDAG